MTIEQQINKLEDALKFPRDLYESVMSNDLYSIEDRFEFLIAFPDFGTTAYRNENEIFDEIDDNILNGEISRGTTWKIEGLIEWLLTTSKEDCRISEDQEYEIKKQCVEDRISRYCFDW